MTIDLDSDTVRRAPAWIFPEALQQLLNDGEGDFVSEIAEIFKSQTAIRIRLLREAVENGRLEEARVQAHTIKGGSSQIGADRLAAVCLEIETADGLSSTATGALVSQAEHEFEVVCRFLSVSPRA